MIENVRRNALGEQVAEQLRLLVVRGDLEPGVHLREEPLSAKFGVSRGPVRDALRVLTAEELVEVSNGKTYVVGLGEDDIDELYDVRSALESLALRSCMERVADADWSGFEEPIERMRAAADRGDAEAFAVADLAFHARFYDLAGNRRLRRIWQQFEPTFSVLLTVTTAVDRDLHPSGEAHAELLALARTGDVGAAATNLETHLRDARDRLRSQRRAEPAAGA